jgi:glycosyltransferase involved in cell wall biosynthesis
MKIQKISIVIPALNEEQGIKAVLDELPVAELKKAGYEVEAIVVDNASTDRTGAIAKAAGAKVVFQPIRGYGNAYKAGFSNATGDIIVTGDADRTYPFDALPKLLAEFKKKKVDFLSTDRLHKDNYQSLTTSHIFGNWILSMVAKLFFGVPFRDSQSGMWLFKRSIWKKLNVTSGGMAFSQELKIEAHKKGFKCAETRIEYRPRVGDVKLNTFRDGFGNISQMFRMRLVYWGLLPKPTEQGELMYAPGE